ncbi:MAG: ABC transporter ATP-binding protein [Actinomycetia bacterium]|nr:ABC transporter ATP-binding protein [Actinomycetes bacterium]MCP4226318.1 ABC transporter ATP-binding protein [Actinomycetes bacterium]MCP5032432.1 ABC transporter ATP-binding protein [Actinomycetes bacterium]
MTSVESTEFTEGTESNRHLLEVEDLRTHFLTARGVVKAVDGVSLSLERGRTLGLVGESGSGKSVLSRSIMRLFPKRNVYSAGRVIFEGSDITAMEDAELRNFWGVEMSMVFQDPMTSLNPVMKIGKQLTEGLRKHLKMPRDEAEATALQLMKSVHIPEPEQRLEEYRHQLSGGMRQRVTIAMALACGPKLLFADEATTALDVTVQAQILNLLAELQEERDMGMILVTHDLGVVAGRTHEIAVMYAGKIVEKAPTNILFSNMKMPYTEALLRSIPKIENPSHTALQAIGGRPPDLISPPDGCNFSPRCPYAQERCHHEEPTLTPADEAGHSYACWYPVGTKENQEALEANLAKGLAQTRVVIESGRTQV